MLRATRFLACLLLAATAAALIGCGGDDGEGGGRPERRGTAQEKAFLTAMVSHHEAAIEMTEIAAERAEDPFIEKLARDIASTQTREIAQMKGIYRRLFDGELRPDPSAHDGLGLSAAEAGMTHSSRTSEMLRSSDPFDRAFVDEMTPHHRGAVRMAEVLLRQTADAPLRKLATRIIATQEREIDQMDAFRKEHFGGPVPEGADHGDGHSG